MYSYKKYIYIKYKADIQQLSIFCKCVQYKTEYSIAYANLYYNIIKWMYLKNKLDIVIYDLTKWEIALSYPPSS